MINIVILGGGFAGVKAGLKLVKANLKNTQITLIDRKSYHLFTPSLYEVATSESPKKNVAIPYSEIFNKKINFIQADVEKIDPKKHIVILNAVKNLGSKKDETLRFTRDDRKKTQDNKISNLPHNAQPLTLPFDYLILALGSEPSFMNIPGLKEYSIPLKTMDDALKIRDHIKSMCCEKGVCKVKTKIIIGGGSFSGSELAAELLMYKDKLAHQNNLDPDCLDISILQGSSHLLNELDPRVSKIAEERISGPDVHYLFGGHIKKVTKNKVFTDDEKQYNFDLLIWTGGVMANHLGKDSTFEVNKHGGIIVNKYLQVNNYPNIFSCGDLAGFIDEKNGKPAPQVAETAEDMGKIAAINVINLINKKTLIEYKIRHIGYVVPLRGRFAVAQFFKFIIISGFLGWVLEQLVYIYYLLTILPFYKAFKKWGKFEMNLRD